MSAKLHTSCYTLPLHLFIQCRIDGDYSVLIIEGEPTAEELKAAWEIIVNQYMDLADKAIDLVKIEQYVQLEALRYRIDTIQNMVEILRVYSAAELGFEDFHDHLRSEGFEFEFNAQDPEKYLKDLNRVIKRSRVLVSEYDFLEARIKEMEKNKTNIKEDRRYYDGVLVALSKFHGYHIDEEKITVSRYAALLNQYCLYIEQLESKSAADGK